MRLHMKYWLSAAALIGAFSASSAQACNLASKLTTHSLSATAPTMSLLATPLNNTDNAPPHDPTGVGLWLSTFTGTDGSTFAGFESLYADGNELLIDNSAPATDNVCSGVWEQTGPRSYTINHPSWDFDSSGNLINIVVLTDYITIDPHGNKYFGTATVTVYDLAMTTIVYQVSGTLTGSRITAKSHPL